jgi:hypothetical protein
MTQTGDCAIHARRKHPLGRRGRRWFVHLIDAECGIRAPNRLTVFLAGGNVAPDFCALPRFTRMATATSATTMISATTASPSVSVVAWRGRMSVVIFFSKYRAGVFRFGAALHAQIGVKHCSAARSVALQFIQEAICVGLISLALRVARQKRGCSTILLVMASAIQLLVGDDRRVGLLLSLHGTHCTGQEHSAATTGRCC